MPVCNDYTYFCRDGSDGRDGSSQNNGYNGGRGRLILIPTTAPLPVEQEDAQVPFANLLSTEVSMNVNLWQIASGAAQLFAPGSIISDDYTYFAGTRGFTYTFDWTAARPIDDFVNATFYLKADDNGVNTWIDRNLWLYSNVERTGNAFKETVTRAMWADESTKLRFSFTGAERTFTAVLDDDAHVSDTMNTTFDISLVKYRRFMWNKTLYEGKVPANLVTVTKDQVTVRLGDLPDLDPTDLEVGNYFYLTMRVNRAFGQDYGASQEFVHEAYIPEKK
jgi:hypothetical protein